METRMQGEGLKKKAKKQNTHNRPYIREVALWKGKRERKKKPLIHRNLSCDSEVKKTKKKQTKKRYCYVETRATVNVSTTTTMKKKKMRVI